VGRHFAIRCQGLFRWIMAWVFLKICLAVIYKNQPGSVESKFLIVIRYPPRDTAGQLTLVWPVTRRRGPRIGQGSSTLLRWPFDKSAIKVCRAGASGGWAGANALAGNRTGLLLATTDFLLLLICIFLAGTTTPLLLVMSVLLSVLLTKNF